MEKEEYKSLRVTKKDNLKIRKTGKKDSAAVGTLKVGDVVEIIYKKKNWTKVRVYKEYDIIEGWVFTRYIDKVK